MTYPACFPDSVAGFLPNPKKASVEYIEYLFRLLRHRLQHENVGTGSVQDNMNLQTLERLRFGLPPLTAQRAIAATLGVLDDKIELNRKMNATLEATARALFRDWFVDVGPTRAKMAGIPPTSPPASGPCSPTVWMMRASRTGGRKDHWTKSPISSMASPCKNTPARMNLIACP